MTAETWLAIAATVLSSAGLFALIQFLISRHDKKKGLNSHWEYDIILSVILYIIPHFPSEKVKGVFS